jgi:hypothetical protein
MCVHKHRWIRYLASDKGANASSHGSSQMNLSKPPESGRGVVLM